MRGAWWGGLAIAAAATALYAGMLDHFFVSDDFLNYERNGFSTVADALRFFANRDIDFYRPIPRLHFGILAGAVGDLPRAWNGMNLLLHVLASLVAWRLARSLLGERGPAAFLAGLFFAVHFIHVEPVLWASGVTSLYVTLFVLLALLGFRRARELGSARWHAVSVAALAGALLSKETAVAFVPLLLLTTAWRPPAGPGGRATPRFPTAGEALPYALLLGAWLFVALGVDRGGDASPYRMSLGGHVLKNAAFFVLGGFLPLRYWHAQELWAESGGIPGFAVALFGDPGLGVPMAAGGLLLGWALVRDRGAARAGTAWILAAAAPFLLLPGSGERFLYLPSFGACLVLGCFGAHLLRGRTVPGGPWAGRAAAAAVLALLVAGNLDRQADWRTASEWTRSIVGRWGFLAELDPEEPIEFVGVPGQHRSAWVFRNGFPSMVRLYWQGRPYGLEGRLPEGAEGEPERMLVIPDPGGTVGMGPEHLLRRP